MMMLQDHDEAGRGVVQELVERTHRSSAYCAGHRLGLHDVMSTRFCWDYVSSKHIHSCRLSFLFCPSLMAIVLLLSLV